jgi:glucose/arabinose dehydrogenase
MKRFVPAIALVLFGLAGCSSEAAVTKTTPASAQPQPTSASIATTESTTADTVAPNQPTSTQPTSSEPVATEPTSTEPAATVPARALTADSLTPTDVALIAGAVDVATRAGDDRLFVVAQRGVVTAVDPIYGETQDVLTMTSNELVSGGEQGLLGLTFSIDGTLAYVNYTNAQGATEITEYSLDDNGTFDPSSKRLLLTIDQPYANHNGGGIEMGPDGMLYIGTGDGGAGGDPQRRALNVGDLLGKMLRIDPRPAPDGSGYSIPSDNPYVGVEGARPEIWSIGLRNPWRFSFDRTTSDLWIADVGQDNWEEIDVAWARDGTGRKANFGWSAFEGTHRFNEDQPADGTTDPIHEYAHGDQGCSISGGVRYRGSAMPELQGWYVYSDYCSGQVRALQINADGTAGQEITFTAKIEGISSIGQDANGELFATSVVAGTVIALTTV